MRKNKGRKEINAENEVKRMKERKERSRRKKEIKETCLEKEMLRRNEK